MLFRSRPDALLPTLGGQTALNTAMALHHNGVLEKFNVELIGANVDAIERGENREIFRGIVEQIGTPLELFDRPGNLFVAQFIGSPAMNILKGTLQLQGGQASVQAEGALWPVGHVGSGQHGQAVHYGVRPSDLTLTSAGQGVAAEVVEIGRAHV